MKGHGHITIGHLKGLVPRVIVTKYEVNALTNKEIMANVKVFATDGRTVQKHMPPFGGIKRMSTIVFSIVHGINFVLQLC